MRLALVGLALVVASPLALAHDDNLVYGLVVPAGHSSGLVAFTLTDDHRFLGIGVGGCALDSVGALRIVTPHGNVLEATMRGVNGCGGSATGVLGEPALLPRGQYVGSFTFVTGSPALVEIYGSHI